MMRCTRASIGAMSCAPLVSISTVRPASHSAVISGSTFFCSSGSPPVISTSGQSVASTSASTSATARFFPS